MSDYDDDFLRLIRDREESFIMAELQSASVATGSIHAEPDLLTRRFQGLLTIAGGVLFGCLTGTIVVILNFIVFIRLLHLQP